MVEWSLEAMVHSNLVPDQSPATKLHKKQANSKPNIKIQHNSQYPETIRIIHIIMEL